MPFIRVSKEVYEELKLWKLEYGRRAFDEVLRDLLFISQKRRGVKKHGEGWTKRMEEFIWTVSIKPN